MERSSPQNRVRSGGRLEVRGGRIAARNGIRQADSASRGRWRIANVPAHTGAGREPRAPSGLSGFGEFPELAQEDVADAVHGMQRQLVAGIAHLRRSRQMATFSVRILVCCRMATSSDRNSRAAVAQQTQEAGALEFGQVEAAATGRKQRPAAVAQRPPAFQPVAGGYQAIDGDALDGMDRRGQGRAGGGQNGSDWAVTITAGSPPDSAPRIRGFRAPETKCNLFERLTGLQAGFPLATPGSD